MKPIDKPNPNFKRLHNTLLRQGEPDRIPFYELFVDPEIMEEVVKGPITSLDSINSQEKNIEFKNTVEFYYQLGYDYVPIGVDLKLPRENILQSEDTAKRPHEKRTWVDEHHSVVGNWEDFKRYPWPVPKNIDYSAFDVVSKRLPSGMKIIGQTSGVLENVMWLMGYEPFSYALYDSPDLVRAIVEKVGSLLVSIHHQLAHMESVGALCMGDDMGHKTGTLISSNQLRRYVFPWQKKIVEQAHGQNKPFILHSCGNLEEVMGEIIDYVGIDAKHSYEDAILPVTEAKRKYGHRICILGGVDVDMLSRACEEKVRSYTRDIIAKCGPGGGYCLGSGNSITNYVKLENYLAMIEEGRMHGTYPL